MMVYALFSLVFILLVFTKLQDPGQLILLRVQAVLMTLALWGVYHMIPCRLMILARFALQLALLSQWYPDTFELNRWMQNQDHLLATWEQQLFGFQPALTFCRDWSSPWISEPLTMGYESYYPLMIIVPLFYYFWRKEQFLLTCFITVASFFLFYVIFVFFPAGGPQYYYPAAGLDQIAQGIFPNIGTYFQGDYEGLPIPGWKDGLMYKTLLIGHAAGERPTAAFPSSHVGVTTVLLWLAWAAHNRKLFFSLLPFGVLMFFATFYIQAHYAIDAIAGIVAGTLMYFLLKSIYSLLKLK
jgi:membrane-associated phospholipid phosphatase